jgi:hypothetical protein
VTLTIAQDIDAGAAEQHIVTELRTDAELIVARATFEAIVSRPTDEDVVAISSNTEIVAIVTDRDA